MRTANIWVAGVILGLVAPATADRPSTTAHPVAYTEMGTKLRGGDTDVDFSALRRAAVAEPHYNGYDQLDARAARAALDAQDWKRLVALCDQQLAHDYLDLNAHLLETVADEKLAQPELADVHRRIVRGLVGAILAGGDGRSGQTAYHVIGVDEEYFLLGVLHLKSQKQSLVMQGGTFDVLDATDDQTRHRDVWFDISPFFGKGPF